MRAGFQPRSRPMLSAVSTPNLMRFGVETADNIGRLRGWKPARTVVAWTWQRAE